MSIRFRTSWLRYKGIWSRGVIARNSSDFSSPLQQLLAIATILIDQTCHTNPLGSIVSTKSMKSLPDSVLTIDDLSDYLKVSKSTLYKLVQGGKVPGQKVGKHWRFRKETIDRWLDRNDDLPAKPR